MMNLFLRAKHWQLFLVTFGIPLILQCFWIYNLVLHVFHDGAIFRQYLQFFPAIILLCAGPLLFWQWSVAVELQKIIPPGMRGTITKFKIFLFVPVIYFWLLIAAAFYLIPTTDNYAGSIVVSFSAFVLIHLFTMFCIFYCIHFVAKTLKTAELQRIVSFGDFVGEFFLIWFYPIGIWILQPRINVLSKALDIANSKIENGNISN